MEQYGKIPEEVVGACFKQTSPTINANGQLEQKTNYYNYYVGLGTTMERLLGEEAFILKAFPYIKEEVEMLEKRGYINIVITGFFNRPFHHAFGLEDNDKVFITREEFDNAIKALKYKQFKSKRII